MYHKMKKESSYLRAAVFEVYKGKCSYCGRTIQERDMHIDHIIPITAKKKNDDELQQYICELEGDGFEVDSIENYLPSCPACNITKSNNIYTTSNFRFFHEKARSNVSKVLKKIQMLKSKDIQETFFEPINIEMWEMLDFSYQRDLSHAIMGYRLTPADVEACPRLDQVEQLKKQLTIADYVVIEGDTGCGKSISIYQVAYDFYKEGWKVYSCKVVENNVFPVIPCNDELTLYIIDDAQQFTENIVEHLKMQARSNSKILFAKTTSTKTNYDTVHITNQDAVNVMYSEFLRNKREIVNIVHKCDKNVGLNFLDQSIERRLEAAKDAITPWQFTYILRGGWQSMKERYKSICKHNNCDMLVAAIAVFQIAKLDKGIDYNKLCEKLYNYDCMFSWDKTDLKYLVNRKIILSEDDIRIVHMESGKVIISLFLEESTDTKKQILYEIVEDAFVTGHISELGIVWLTNGLEKYLSFGNRDKLFISQKMINHAVDSLNIIQLSEKRLGITYFIEKIFNSGYIRNGKYYFDKNQNVFLEWIETANSKTAYSFSCLLNTLHNDDKKKYQKFVKKIKWTKLQEAFLQEDKPNLYAWGSLFDRIICFFNKETYLKFGKFLEKIVNTVIARATIINIKEVSSFLCSVAYTNPDYVHSAIRKILPLYKNFFEQDICDAINIFDFEFLLYFCGVSLLGGHRATPDEKETASKIVSVLPETQFADIISNGSPKEWHRIYPVMCLITHYDLKKAKRIINLIDLTKLSKCAKDYWTQSHEITELCDSIYCVNPKKARTFIEENEKSITTMYSSLAMMAPKCAIKVFKRGVPVDLLTGHWWDASLNSLVNLYKVDKEMAKEILLKNVPHIIKRMNNITALDFKEKYCLDFLYYVKKEDEEIFYTIIAEIDKHKILKNWDRGVVEPKKKKIVEKRKKDLFELIKLEVE